MSKRQGEFGALIAGHGGAVLIMALLVGLDALPPVTGLVIVGVGQFLVGVWVAAKA